jgi:hypothetical protein
MECNYLLILSQGKSSRREKNLRAYLAENKRRRFDVDHSDLDFRTLEEGLVEMRVGRGIAGRSCIEMVATE